MRNLLLALTIFLCACCASAPEYSYVFGASRLSPEGWYEISYTEVVACAKKLRLYSGVKYADIEWFVTASGAMGDFVGLTSFPWRIYLDYGYTMNMDIIRHEEAHIALKTPHNRHDSPAFMLCSGAVAAPAPDTTS